MSSTSGSTSSYTSTTLPSPTVANPRKARKDIKKTDEEVWEFMDDAIIALDSRKWHPETMNNLYKGHFQWPPSISRVEDTATGKKQIFYQFYCQRDIKREHNPITRARGQTSTINLKSHQTNCNKKNGVLAGQPGTRRFTNGRLRAKVVRWTSRRRRPFAIIDDPELRDIFNYIRPGIKMPSSKTVSHDTTRIYHRASKQLAAHLRSGPITSLHLGLDGWSAPNGVG